MFVVLLASIAHSCHHTKYVSLSIQKCEIQPTLISLHPNKFSQEFHYYIFAVKLDRCVGKCNTLHNLSSKVRVPNKAEELNLSVFRMMTLHHILSHLLKKSLMENFIFCAVLQA